MDYCAHCKSTTATLRCRGCHGVLYCNAEHQKADWKNHKATCKLLQKAAAGNGVEKVVHKEGTGPTPKYQQSVRVKYAGRLPSGKQFDASDEFVFVVGAGQVIKGWDIAVWDMHVGEEATVYITAECGYGHEGSPGAIPPDSPLVFDITLLEVIS